MRPDAGPRSGARPHRRLGSVNPVAVTTSRRAEHRSTLRELARDVTADPAQSRSRERHRRAAITSASAIAPKLLNLAILLVGAGRGLNVAARRIRRLAASHHGIGAARIRRPRPGERPPERSRGRQRSGGPRRDAPCDRERVGGVAARGRVPGGRLPPDHSVRFMVATARRRGPSSGSVTPAIGVFVVAPRLGVAFGAAPRVRLALQTGWVNNVWGAAGGVVSLAAVVVAAGCGAGCRCSSPPHSSDRLWCRRRTRCSSSASNGRSCDRSGRLFTGWMQPASAARARCSASWRSPSRSGTSPTRW